MRGAKFIDMRRVALGVGAYIICTLTGFAQSKDSLHHKVYEKAKDSVVAIRVFAQFGERSGSGVILDQEGYILTSTATVPPDSEYIRVWLKGPRLVENIDYGEGIIERVRLVGTVKESEISILKIVDPKRLKLKLKPIEFGRTDKLKIGEITYTLGNAYNSMIKSDQPSLSAGLLSGVYTVRVAKKLASYLGRMLETTAAVNEGMDGAPLLNQEGKMIGMISRNYSPNRFLGLAIPVEALMYDIESLKKRDKKRFVDKDQLDELTRGRPYLGLDVKWEDSRLVVSEVKEDSPAWDAGIREGDVIVALGDTEITSAEQFINTIDRYKPGTIIWLKVDLGGEGLIQKVRITLGKEGEKGSEDK
jgi:S1-C subfamily serine protease